MKYWEIVKNLTENPALSGVAVIDSIRYELYVNDSGILKSKTYYLKLGTNGTSIGKAGYIFLMAGNSSNSLSPGRKRFRRGWKGRR